jgi:hypothetical protein
MRRRCGLLAAFMPTQALAHASERMLVLTLPTERYILGAAATVALTALVVPLAPRLPPLRPRRLADLPAPPLALTSWAACLVLLALVAIGLLGPRDPLGNLLPLTVWTLLWVGLTLATMLLGDLWRGIDPWTGPATTLRRLLGRRGGIGLARLGHWPAVAGLLGFAWFELVSLAPDDPAVLARAVLLYWLAILVLTVLEGPAWLRQGEFLTVFFGLIARIAPLWWEPREGRLRLMAGPPGAQILTMPPLGPDAAAFLTLILASVSFDGLHDTFRWLAFIGVNPLAFPGRSAVQGANTLGLLAAWAATAAAILGSIALGRRIAGRRTSFWREAGPVLLSFLPIAAGYHAAHYLVALLTGARYTLAALDDPLGRGRHLLGLSEHWVSLGFLADAAAVRAIWNAQFALILGAHLLAVLLNHRLAPAGSSLGRAPMTILMVLYTVFGLWLLSAATGA